MTSVEHLVQLLLVQSMSSPFLCKTCTKAMCVHRKLTIVSAWKKRRLTIVSVRKPTVLEQGDSDLFEVWKPTVLESGLDNDLFEVQKPTDFEKVWDSNPLASYMCPQCRASCRKFLPKDFQDEGICRICGGVVCEPL